MTWPVDVPFVTSDLRLEAHSIGGAGDGGHTAFRRGPGSRWRMRAEVPALSIAQALSLRGFLHGLRGRGFTVAVPSASQPVTFATYDDGTDFTDDTTYDDAFSAAFLAVGITSLTNDTFAVSATSGLSIGAYATYVSGNNAHLVQIVDVSGLNVEVRPRPRFAPIAGARLELNPALATFRIDGAVPEIPLVNSRSLAFALDLIEAY